MESNGSRHDIVEYSSEQIIGLATFTISIIALAIPANILVLIAYLTSSSARQKPSNHLLVNMTVSELVTAGAVIPLQLASILRPALVWDGGAVCAAIGYTTYPFYIVSVATMVCISIDRLYAIRLPLVYKTKMSGTRIAWMIAYTWLHGTTFAILFGLLVGYKHSEDSIECGIPWQNLHFAVSILTATTHVALPFVLLMGLNWNLVLCLRRQNRTLEAHIGGTLPGVDRTRVRKNRLRQAQERNVSCMVLWLITTYLICWAPYLVTRCLQITPIKPTPLIDLATGLVLHTSVLINPVLNLVFRKELRLTIARLFTKSNQVFPTSPTFLSGPTSRAATVRSDEHSRI